LPRTSRSPRHARLGDIFALVSAASFAKEMKSPLNAQLTVFWKNNRSYRRKGWQKMDEQLIRLMRVYLERDGVALTYAYLRENVVGRGPHTHFLIHLAPARWGSLASGLTKHLTTGLGFAPQGEVVGPKPILITGDKFGSRGMKTDSQIGGLVRYLSKSMDPGEAMGDQPLVEYLGIDTKPHAPVACRRISASMTIGPSARRRAGWQEIADVGALRRFLDGDVDVQRKGDAITGRFGDDAAPPARCATRPERVVAIDPARPD
jgi:hypothetical protein